MKNRNNEEKFNCIITQEQNGDTAPGTDGQEAAGRDGNAAEPDAAQAQNNAQDAAQVQDNAQDAAQEQDNAQDTAQEQDNAQDAAQEQDNAQDAAQPDKKQMPPVKPSTIILMCLFALLFTLGYFFMPYITQYLPMGGETVSRDLGIQKADYAYLVSNACSVVIGKSEQQRTVYSDDITVSSQPLVYTEHLFKVDRVVYGSPVMEDEQYLITYTLGGTVVLKDGYGRPQRVNYKYNDAAELNGTVLLFLDDQNNIISERYGVFRQHKEELFYDVSGTVYSLSDIATALAARG